MLLKIHLLCSRSYSSSTPKICFPPSLTLGDFFWWCHCAMSSQRLVQKCLSVLRKQACRSTQYSPFPLWAHQFFPRLCSEMAAARFSFSSSFTEHMLPIEQSAFTHLLIIFPLRTEVTESVPHPQTLQTPCDTSLIVKQCWKSSLHKCTVTHTMHIPDVIIWMLYTSYTP